MTPHRTGSLYIVATPIGNLEDITLRALRVLKEAALIAAEDTRETKKLLAHYGISTPMTSYFEHNEAEKAPAIIEELKRGRGVALVSEAGTPGISDPGYRLIRLAIENSIPVVPIPGPSAVISVLSASGLPINEFTFKGFVPAGAADRKRFLLALMAPEHTFVMYESARRLKETLKDALEVMGDAEVIIGREVTKLHEEFIRGRMSEVIEAVRERELKGEVTLLVRTGRKEAGGSPREEITKLLNAGFRLKDAVKAVADEFGLPKSDIYKEALKVKEEMEG